MNLSTADLNDQSVEHFVKLVEPKLQFYVDLKRNHKLLQALLELNVQNDDEFELLSDNYKSLVHNKQNLEETFKRDSSNLDRLIGILTEFYIDKNKFKGMNVKNRMETLLETLHNYKSGSLMEIFCATHDHKN